MFTSAGGRRVWLVVFAVLIALECVPFWAVRYFPSQDGPSHLHNALVTAHYAADPLYRDYYRLTWFQPGGNLLTHLVLVGLVKIAPPLIAEKILLSGYVALFAIGFHYLLGAFTKQARSVAFFVFLLVPNLFFHLGFWNFCYGIALSLFAIGYFIRRLGRWTALSIAGLALWSIVTYLTHPVSWAIYAAAVGFMGLFSVLASRGPSFWREVKQYLWLVASQCPPALLFLWHSLRAHAESYACDAGGSLRSRLWSFYSMSFLDSTILPFDKTLERSLAVALGVFFLAAVVSRWRRWRHLSLLAFGVICILLMVAAPGCVGSASLIRPRIGFYALLFLAIWLASQDWPDWVARIVGAGCALAAIAVAIASFPVYSHWDESLSEVVAMGRSIRPGSTVLLANTDHSLEGISPYRHAAGLLDGRGIVDLGNYEAAIGYYFFVGFQPGVTPIPALGTIEQLQSVPPVFDPSRYARETHGHLDYILARGPGTLSQEQLTGFYLAAQKADIRLYARSKTNSLQPIVPPQVAILVKVNPRLR